MLTAMEVYILNVSPYFTRLTGRHELCSLLSAQLLASLCECVLCCFRLKRDLDMILHNVGHTTQDSALVNIISLLTSSIRQLQVCMLHSANFPFMYGMSDVILICVCDV